MNLQPIQTKLLTGGLFALSACGTIALFGCVPVIARMLSSDSNPLTSHPLQPALQPSLDLRSSDYPHPIKPDPRS